MSVNSEDRDEIEPAPESVFNTLMKSMAKNSVSLGLFSVLTVGLIALTYVFTKDRITEQVRYYEAKALLEILPEETHDNNLLDTTLIIAPSKLLATQYERKAYVAFKQQQPVAVILPVVAPDGYNGRIDLLVGITSEGILTGVRVVTHKETPGLGDKIDTHVSKWIFDFTGKSIINPSNKGWAVKKDGGQFDQFTGATITPRAVVSAIYRALEYFHQHHAGLLDNASLRQESSGVKENKHD